jgi:BirA family biotin operon repressor/biotin-[acetyl-CoA-carboxylase] ligase
MNLENLLFIDTIDSTNKKLKELLVENPDLPDYFCVAADYQSAGRGQGSNRWQSDKGQNVLASMLFNPSYPPSRQFVLNQCFALSVRKLLSEFVEGVKIKWPNDVLLEGKKMVGILTEMSAEFGKINYIVIGTGINTNVPKSMIPDELKDLAISVADVAREPIQRVQILADYLKNMEDLYETVLREGFGPVLDEWRTYSDAIGQAVKVIAPDKTYFGTAVDIDKEGLLIVKKEDGTMEKVIAGDVSIRPAAAKGKRYS